MTQQQFLEELEKTYKECVEISRKKNTDYTGSTNPFANFENSTTVGVPVSRGILVRIMDKISRINVLLDNAPLVKDEKLEDTLLDAINYLAILRTYINAKKVNQEEVPVEFTYPEEKKIFYAEVGEFKNGNLS